MDDVVLAPGLHVAGKYLLLRPLARGAMGEVWLATHATLGGELAVKFLSRSPTHDGEDEATAMARFRFEAQVAARLSRRSRHIVSVTDHGEEHGFAYLVMELVKGESLEAFLAREGTRAGRLSLATLGPIVAQIARGLSHAHADGVFHRDLKPANVLLTTDEDGALLVKILDFGIAKAIRSHKVTGAHKVGHATEIGIVLGTPSYMSPEQARGLASLDHRCDLWALAALAYEALCGRLPYDGETTNDLLINVCSSDPVPIRTHRPDLPPAADAFFARAFAAKPDDRFPEAASFARAFAEVVAADATVTAGATADATSAGDATAPPAEALPASPSLSAPTKRRTRPALWIGAVAVVLASALAVIGVSYSREGTRRTADAPTPSHTVASAPPPSSDAPSSAAPPIASPTPSAMKAPESAAGKPTAKVPVHKPAEKPTAPAPVQSSPPKKSFDKGEVL